MEHTTLGPLTVPRVWTGLWQLSSPAWGTAPSARIKREMGRHVSEGYTAFADHYGSAELLFGQYRASLDNPTTVVGATKWCVFAPTTITRQVVLDAITERIERMKSKPVDVLQFHWQNYDDKAYLQALSHLKDLQSEGYITTIGLCNFDTIRTDEICTYLGPGCIVSNQVQCGGFLADKWLGAPEPDAYRETMTPSQRKYLDMIVSAWGSWTLFQSLLRVLREIGDRHGGVSIANVSTRWVLEHTFVGAVIIGARLGVSEHTSDNHLAFSFRLDKQDLADIEAVLDKSNGRLLVRTIGDCGSEYR